MVDLPSDRNPIATNVGINGGNCFQAALVSLGLAKKYDQDYDEVFVRLLRITTSRIFLALAAKR